MKLAERIQQQQSDRRAQHLWRQRFALQSPQQTHVKIDECEKIVFCSNDYLGLANHPEIISATQSALNHYGIGSGASQLIVGHFQAHQECEQAFANFLERDRAIFFANGYAANLGVISALLQRGDTIFQDKLNHASLIDGALLSRATLRRYQHGDMTQLAELLSAGSQGVKFIASDAIFSMDGDMAPLSALAQHSKEFAADLMIDDAHGIGIFGKNGRGSLEVHGLTQREVPLLVCPLGKAFGCSGAIVAGPDIYLEHLIQFARSLIYSTAPPPALAVAASTSLQILQKESWRREKLFENIAYFQHLATEKKLPIQFSQSPIQTVKMNDSLDAMNFSKSLLHQGFVISAIRPPTVPANASRLRLTITAMHTQEDIHQVVTALERAYADV